ncbi:hypothetical protein BVG16_01935 [Paenibacillus selenitireducens]|uniref:Radical SAM protein n=1 Tax=Paenibacillus selenitireducens TaxID=1324314 RepID=A0A1T2XN56_9BACL|nr:hypothetical protein [Paenibacillus selenitireducens]OPA81123.1 hypothetical protein BVG16_01935 [Paenibacillus selenitireducens]
MTNFELDERLGIHVPALQQEWDQFSTQERERILYKWEEIRGTIPNRIFDLEQMINYKQDQLFDEDDFEKSCQLNAEIAELASQINDLHIWYRVNQDVRSKVHS